MTRRPWRALLPALLIAAGSHAQSFVTLELNLASPGARSLGFGGAFVALADDATAAFANPAGLVQLQRPEVSFEGRRLGYTTPFTQGGRVSGSPTGLGVDTASGLRTAESTADLTGLSFLSYVYPGRRWALAIYRHRLADYAYAAETQGLFSDLPPEVGTGNFRLDDRRSATELSITSYGVSGALRLSESLSVGAGVTIFDGQGSTRQERYLPDDFSLEGYFGVNSYLPERLIWRSLGTVDDDDWGWSAGLLWRISDRWHLGAVYRQGPRFDSELGLVPGPAGNEPGGHITVPLAFPDLHGIGLAYRSLSGRFTASFEWEHVRYHALLAALPDGIREPTDRLDDGDELHLGAEYAFLDATPIVALRVGLWRDPDHRFGTTSQEPFERALLRPGRDELHFALGFGVAYGSLQFDLGVDLSDLVDTASVSMIISF